MFAIELRHAIDSLASLWSAKYDREALELIYFMRIRDVASALVHLKHEVASRWLGHFGDPAPSGNVAQVLFDFLDELLGGRVANLQASSSNNSIGYCSMR